MPSLPPQWLVFTFWWWSVEGSLLHVTGNILLYGQTPNNKVCATPGEYHMISCLFGVGIATVCKLVHQVTSTLMDNLYQRFISLLTRQHFDDNIQGSKERWYPKCAGAIDGTHIPIISYRNWRWWVGWRFLYISHIIADAVYPLKPWLLRGFTQHQLSQEQASYTHTLGSARMAVENALWWLKGCWRCLMRRNDIDLCWCQIV